MKIYQKLENATLQIDFCIPIVWPTSSLSPVLILNDLKWLWTKRLSHKHFYNFLLEDIIINANMSSVFLYVMNVEASWWI